MRNKAALLILALLVVASVSLLTYYFGSKNSPQVTKSDRDKAYQLARNIYELKRKQGEDFTSGPCLSDNLMADWVADTVHQPRAAIDNLPQNQCNAYLEGRAHHFVELDTKGNLVRIY